MQLNTINETIFKTMNAWFIILQVLSTLVIIYRVALFISTSVRARRLQLLAPTISFLKLKEYTDSCRIEDLFFLIMIGKNIETDHFSSVVSDLAILQKGTEEDVNRYVSILSLVFKINATADHFFSCSSSVNLQPAQSWPAHKCKASTQVVV
jgi:Innexin